MMMINKKNPENTPVEKCSFMKVFDTHQQHYKRSETHSQRDMEAAGEEEQERMSVHSPFQAPPSSASSLTKEQQSQVELELRLLEALEVYPPAKLKGIHQHFVLYGLMKYLRKSFDMHFSSSEVLRLLDSFYNLDMLKSEEDEMGNLNEDEDFCLPPRIFVKEES